MKHRPHIISFEEFAGIMQQVVHTPTVSQEYFRKFGFTKILRYAKIFFYDRRYSTSLIFSEDEYQHQELLYQKVINRLLSFINFNARTRYLLAEYVYSFEMRFKSILSDLLVVNKAGSGGDILPRPIDWTFSHLLKMAWNLKIDTFVQVMWELFGMDSFQEINGMKIPKDKKGTYAFAFVLFYFTAGISILRNNLSHNDLIYDFKRNKSMGRVFSYMKECYHWTKKDSKLNDDLWSRHLTAKGQKIILDLTFFKREANDREKFLTYAQNFHLIQKILQDFFNINFRDQNQGKLLGFLEIFDIFFFKDNKLLVFNERVVNPNFTLFSSDLIASGFKHSLKIKLADLFLNDYQEFRETLFGHPENWTEEDQEIIKNMNVIFGVAKPIKSRM